MIHTSTQESVDLQKDSILIAVKRCSSLNSSGCEQWGEGLSNQSSRLSKFRFFFVSYKGLYITES